MSAHFIYALQRERVCRDENTTVTRRQRKVSGKGIETKLTDRSLTALKWNYAGVGIKIVLQFMVGVVLARLLGPGPFGVYTAVLLVGGISGVVVERGFGGALIQMHDLSEDVVCYAFTWLVLTGVGAAAVLCVAAHSVAAVFRYPAMTTAIYGSALYVIMYALSVVPRALLRRDLDMKSDQIAQVVAYLAGFVVVGVGGAFVGLGPWSLIGALLTQLIVYVLIAYARVQHTIRPLFRLPAKEFTSFGNLLTVTNLLNWGIENLDNVVVGRVYGIHALGLYSVSYNLVRTPTDHLITTAQGVVFASAARAQKNVLALQKAYLAAVSAVLLISCPVFLGVASVAPTIVEGIYGAKWAGGETLLLPLALAMPVHALLVGSGLLWARGQGAAERNVEAGTLGIFLVGLLIAPRISLQAIAWTVLTVYALRALWLTLNILKSIQLPWGDFFAAVRGGLCLGTVTAVTFYMVDMVLAAGGMIALNRVFILGGVGLIIITVLPICIRGLISSQELRTVLERAVPESPGLLRTVMQLYAKP
jgi:O-antigen/teichoic acid export membrane protein